MEQLQMCNITVNIVLLGNTRGNYTTAGIYRTIVFSYFYIVLHVHLYTSSHLFKKMNETRYKNILSEIVSGI